MSFSLLRVPKKATLTALRGLIAGTSCTLLLLTEDRRRRINQARCAIHNADRIRSSKQYHAARAVLDGQSSAALKDIEDVAYSLEVVHSHGLWRVKRRDHDDLHPQLQIQQVREVPNAAETTHSTSAETSRDWNSTSEGINSTPHQQKAADPAAHGSKSADRALPRSRIRLAAPAKRQQQPDLGLFKQPLPITSNATLSKDRKDLPERQDVNVQENVRRITQTGEAGRLDLENAVNILGKTVRKAHLAEREKQALVNTAISLCNRCQEAGVMDLAADTLHHLVSLGSLTEAEYYAARPEPVISHALSAVGAQLQAEQNQGQDLDKRQQTRMRKRLSRAIKLLMPFFAEGTLSPMRVDEWMLPAQTAMDLALKLDMAVQAADIYWRVQHYDGDKTGAITLRFLESNSERGRSSRVVNTFNLIRHQLARYGPDVWYPIGDLVAAAAENAPGQDPAKLLSNMTSFCPADACSPQRPLRTTWVTKLLYCRWLRTKDFDQTVEAFRHFEDLNGFDKVVHQDGPYRVMMQIAVEAERWSEVDKFTQKLRSVKPSSSKDARILGLVALAKAKLGDWNGVWEEFKRMEINDRIENVFAPVLHEFIKTHTTKEIEDFLKVYIQDLKMPIGSFMVNMVANRYGDVRDVQSFVDWLAYCTSRGFKVDAAFGNAILTNCRRRWSFSYVDLKLIYRTLQALSPDFVDGVTENDMLASIMRTHRNARPAFIKKEMASVGARSSGWRGSSDVESLRVEMRHAFVTRNFKRVLLLYRTACKRRVQVDGGHLRIAVKSVLKVERHSQPAFALIKEGRAKGIDISTCITPIFLFQIRPVFWGDRSDKNNLLRQVRSVIARFEANDLNLGHQDMLRAAHLLLQAKHYQGAISFGLSALQRKGITYPDDVPTFQLLIQAYAYKSDVQGMKWTIAGAVHTQYYHKKSVFTALKDTRKLLQRQIQSNDVKQCLWVVEKGLDKARLLRLALAKERKGLERATIDIMRRAALEAGEPQDSEVRRRQLEILEELEARERKEKEDERAREANRKADMESRRRAAEELELENQEASEVMMDILMKNKHDFPMGF